MKKIIITSAIILTTGLIATSGIKLINQKNIKAQNVTINKGSIHENEIASAD